MKKLVVIKVVSYSYIFYSLFWYSPLNIFLPFLTVWLWNIILQLWSKTLKNDSDRWRIIFHENGTPSRCFLIFLIASSEQLLRRKGFLKILIFWNIFWWQLVVAVAHINWTLTYGILIDPAVLIHLTSQLILVIINKQIKHYLLMKETERLYQMLTSFQANV